MDDFTPYERAFTHAPRLTNGEEQLRQRGLSLVEQEKIQPTYKWRVERLHDELNTVVGPNTLKKSMEKGGFTLAAETDWHPPGRSIEHVLKHRRELLSEQAWKNREDAAKWLGRFELDPTETRWTQNDHIPLEFNIQEVDGAYVIVKAIKGRYATMSMHSSLAGAKYVLRWQAYTGRYGYAVGYSDDVDSPYIGVPKLLDRVVPPRHKLLMSAKNTSWQLKIQGATCDATIRDLKTKHQAVMLRQALLVSGGIDAVAVSLTGGEK